MTPGWDFQNGTWTQVERWAQAELLRLREKNDALELPPEATAGLRGEIAALKRLIGLPAYIASCEEEAHARAGSADSPFGGWGG